MASKSELTETAATVQKAIEAGAKKLGIDPHEAGYEVIEEGRAGVFGIGAKKAKVRVFLKDARHGEDEAPKAGPKRDTASRESLKQSDAARRGPRTAGRGARGRGGRGRGDEAKEAPARGESPVRSGRGGRGGDAARGRSEAPHARSTRDVSPHETGDERPARGERSDRTERESSGRSAERAEGPGRMEKISPEDPALRETIEFVGRCLDDSFHVLGFKEEEDGEHVVFEVAAKNLGLVLGRRGITLDAIETVSRAALSAKGMGRIRLVLDVEGFRDRRQSVLEEMAREAATEVEGTNESIRLDPMSARDRRIIHEALKDSTTIRTESEGRGDDRYVVLFPASAEASRERGDSDRGGRDRGGRGGRDRDGGRGGRDGGRGRGPRREGGRGRSESHGRDRAPRHEEQFDGNRAEAPREEPLREERPEREESPRDESPRQERRPERAEPPTRREPVATAPAAQKAAPTVVVAPPARRLTMGTKRFRRK